ncbi:MAG: NINE protein [Candidatus Nanopelagicales bacterium]|nr:NINE protein [Candidatus Nanopelagicales bacterium]
MSQTPEPFNAPVQPHVTAAPGWYPSPEGTREERYWDGVAWTSSIRPTMRTASGGLLTAPDGSPVSSKSRLVALLLAIFLGMFGVHSFYVGRVGVGIGQIAITVVTLGIFGWVWPLVDIIMLAVGSYRDSIGRLILNWNE